MSDIIVLTEVELDVVAGGYTAIQTNTSSYQISAGNSNNNGSGNVTGPGNTLSYGNVNNLPSWEGPFSL